MYTGLHRSPDEIVETAIQEDVDAIGLSILSGAHMTLLPKVVEILKQKDAGDIVVHVFRPEVRGFYKLEKMWGVDLPESDVIPQGPDAGSDPDAEAE